MSASAAARARAYVFSRKVSLCEGSGARVPPADRREAARAAEARERVRRALGEAYVGGERRGVSD